MQHLISGRQGKYQKMMWGPGANRSAKFGGWEKDKVKGLPSKGNSATQRKGKKKDNDEVNILSALTKKMRRK